MAKLKVLDWEGVKELVAEVTTCLDTKANANHTHNYAGSNTAGGVANSATKLAASAGNTKTPVYFKDGVPTALGYTIEKSVPADAVFTDTKYTLASFGITSSAAELNHCKGVTSNIQTQLNGKAASSHSHNYLPLSGGKLTGNLEGQYIAGAWLQTTAAGEVSTASKICVLDASGWIYYITPTKLLGDYTTKKYVDSLMTVETTLEV